MLIVIVTSGFRCYFTSKLRDTITLRLVPVLTLPSPLLYNHFSQAPLELSNS